MREDDILSPSEASFIGTIIISIGTRFRFLRKAFKIAPF